MVDGTGSLTEPWIPQDRTTALFVALLSLVCWGTWSNTAKAAEYLAFPYYYMDFSVGVCVTSLLFWATLGVRWLAKEPDSDTLGTDLEWMHDARLQIIASVGAGAVFNVANLLLVVGIQIAGLSIAFPITIGTALALGTILTYFIDEVGDPYYLFSGVGLGVLAILSMARAHHLMDIQREEAIHSTVAAKTSLLAEEPLLASNATMPVQSERSLPTERSAQFKLLLCLVSGLLMSLWNPLAAYSRDGDDALSTYGSFVLYCMAVLITSPVLLVLQNKGVLIPRIGDPVKLSGYCRLSTSDHAWGLLGGMIWAIGTLASLVSGDELGYAISYAIGQSAPLVATLWGLLWYREFTGSPSPVYGYLGLMFVFYSGAVSIIAVGGGTATKTSNHTGNHTFVDGGY